MVTIDPAQKLWADLNGRYFDGALPPISIVWSRRLTSSAGLFMSHGGPRAADVPQPADGRSRCCIKLSRPLLDAGTRIGDLELTRTLAHEMIHQWQYDVLKRRPNHGADFRRMMHRMNQDGLSITIYHSLARETDALARYAWRCQQCGHIYRRQRRTIKPRRHQCGVCRGPLKELALTTCIRTDEQRSIESGLREDVGLTTFRRTVEPMSQLALPFRRP
ncbi:MAG: SprT-like domain-containing protein [Nitrospiraceae bacterium]